MAEEVVGQRESFLRGYKAAIKDVKQISIGLRHLSLRGLASSETILIKLDQEIEKLEE